MELAKKPRKPKESKWAKDAQRKAQRDIGAQKQKQNSGHVKPLREGINGRPKKGLAGLSYYGKNNSTTLQEIKKTREWAKRM